jgi:hypothetical protein
VTSLACALEVCCVLCVVHLFAPCPVGVSAGVNSGAVWLTPSHWVRQTPSYSQRMPLRGAKCHCGQATRALLRQACATPGPRMHSAGNLVRPRPAAPGAALPHPRLREQLLPRLTFCGSIC